MINIGKQIQFYRKKEKYSQAELAQKLHMTRQAISNWERGVSEPDLESIQHMADIFQIPLQTLLHGDEHEIGNQRQLKIIKRLYIVCSCLFLLFCFQVFANQVSLIALIQPLILMLMTSTLYLVFSNSIQSKEFSMIAGYDDTLHYNTQTLCTILLFILLQILLMHVFLNILMILLIWLQLLKFIPLLFVLYIINFFGSIVVTNRKYRNQIFTNEHDLALSRKGNHYVLYFVFHLIFLILAVFLTFHLHSIQNNTKEAILVLLFTVPVLLYHLILLLLGDTRLKKDCPLSKKWFIIGYFMSILMIILMLFFPY